MDVVKFVEGIKELGISLITGIPDSVLKPFCDFCSSPDLQGLAHHVPANEGAAVGIAIGTYLATGKPACVYMQNSGLGNAVNPVTSLANREVYGIPMLFIVGWRGAPGEKDEPQHRFMGKITEDLLSLLGIEYTVLTKETGPEDMEKAFLAAGKAFENHSQYAFLVRRGAFENENPHTYRNPFRLCREKAVEEIIRFLGPDDVIVSTTGKISREVYEQAERILGGHERCFLTVGGMGHASMIALGIALSCPEKTVYCVEGDGAVLMHLGSMACIGAKKLNNLIHICLNNRAHESVGGMPTGVGTLDYCRLAAEAGYGYAALAETEEELSAGLAAAKKAGRTAFLEVRVSMDSRADLGRPQETAEENRQSFMKAVRSGEGEASR